MKFYNWITIALLSFVSIVSAQWHISGEGFENEWPPTGWDRGNWEHSLYSAPHNGSEYASIWEAESPLKTPAFIAKEGDKVIFWYRAEVEGTPVDIDVRILVSGQPYVSIGCFENVTSETYQEGIVEIPISYAGQEVNIGFIRKPNDNWTTIAIDDIKIGQPADYPIVNFNPSICDFNLIQEGANGTIAVQLQNQGAQDLEITGYELNDSFSCDILPCTIPANDSITVNIEFHPLVIGDISDTLKIISNAPIQGKIALSGISYPSTYTFEGFESFPLDGWNLDENWQQNQTGYLSHSGTASARCVYTSDESMISPNLDLSTGSHFVSFFWWEGGISMINDSTVISLSSDGGSTWERLGSVGHNGGNWVFTKYDLGEVNSDNCYIKWNYLGNPSLGMSIFIDDVCLPHKYDSSIKDGNLINNVELSQNYPNPFNNTTVINFNLKNNNYKTGFMNIYNANGQLIEHNKLKSLLTGEHKMNFDASRLNSGVYYYSLSLDGKISGAKKMIFLK